MLHFLLENQKKWQPPPPDSFPPTCNSAWTFTVSCVDFPPHIIQKREIYIDDVTNLHNQDEKVDTWKDVRMNPLRIYTNKGYISFFDFRTKNKILFERKRVPFFFLYLYF